MRKKFKLLVCLSSSSHKQAASQLTSIFTARCYAERGYATICRLSVCPSVRIMFTKHGEHR